MSVNNRMISVAMATYNGQHYIIEQLDSIRTQTQKVDEIVIVDDCSNDGTVRTIEDYISQHPACNIKLYINEKNLGYKKNFHKALSLCSGDITFLCDQDDVWMKNKVERMCKQWDEQPNIGVVSSAFVQIDGKGNIQGSKCVYRRKMKAGELVCVPIEDLIFHNISQGCAMAITKEIKEQFLACFSEKLPHDWIMNVVAAIEKKCYYLNDHLFYYRIHDKNTIGLSDNLTIQKKNTLEIRKHDAVQAIKVLDYIHETDNCFYTGNAKLEKMKSFAISHVNNLENKKVFHIIGQNFNENYKKLKSFRGRLMDIIFVLNKL